MGSNASLIFCGTELSANAEVKGIEGDAGTSIKVFPRTIGAVISFNGINKRKLTVQGRAIVDGVSRTELEIRMNTFNEFVAPKIGTVTIDENDYLACAVNSVKYQPKILNNYLIFDIDFAIGVQKTNVDGAGEVIQDIDIAIPRQMVPRTLYADNVGRTGTFVSSKNGSRFDFWHNIDMVRDMDNTLIEAVYDKDGKEMFYRQQGGIEKITIYGWLRSSQQNQHDGWKQTVGAYMFNMINGPMGDLGDLYVGKNNTKVVSNCLLTSAKLTGLWPTSATYEITLLASLQC